MASLLVAAATIVGPAAPPAAAFDLATDYPSVRVQPGQTLTFDLDITSDRRERVSLRVAAAPEGWTTTLRGGGFEISGVFTDPDIKPAVQLDVTVPEDAQPGTYQIAVEATGPGETEVLTLDLEVTPEAAGAFELTTDFPRLVGGASDTFRFDLDLRNNSARAVTFALEASGPEGWEVRARPVTEQQATVLPVEPGATGSIQVTVDPPDDVEAGTYEVTVRASGAGQTLSQTLTVEILGSFELRLSTADERLNASGTAGGRSRINLVIFNDGTAPLVGVSLRASAPSGWEVTFEPETVDVVPPGESVPVTAVVRPSGDAVAGDYALTITASAAGSSDSVDIRFAVETSGVFGLIGIGVIVVAVAVLLWVFRRYGRR